MNPLFYYVDKFYFM